MATSGDYGFNPTVSRIINGALRLLSALQSGEVPPEDEAQDAIDAFNGLVANWQAAGLHLWTKEECTLFFQPKQFIYGIGTASADHVALSSQVIETFLLDPANVGDTTLTVLSNAGMACDYVLGLWVEDGAVFWTMISAPPAGNTIALAAPVPVLAAAGSRVVAYPANVVRPLRILGGRAALLATVTAAETETPLIPLSRLDFENINNKAPASNPLQQYFYDPQLITGLMNINPAPVDATYAMNFTAQLPLQDFTNLAQTADFPAEWISALRFALAVELAPEYDVPSERFQVLKALSDEKYAIVSKWDAETEGTTTSSFSQGIYQLIAGALRLCRATGPQDVPNHGRILNGFYSLNAMVQAWQASGIHVWAEEDCTLFLQPKQITYMIGSTSLDHVTLTNAWVQTALVSTAAGGSSTIVVASPNGIAAFDQIGVWLDSGVTFWTLVNSITGSTVTLGTPLPSQATAGAMVVDYTTELVRPLRVPAGRRLQFSVPGGQPIEIPMIVMSRIDYANVPNKTTPGTITQYFYDPQLNLGVMNVWPAPTTNQNAMKFTAQRPLNTFLNLSSVPDFPVEWNRALRFNLAVELAPEYGTLDPNAFTQLMTNAAEHLRVAQAWDREPESIRFGVSYDPTSRN